jgi:hypothetical protein
MFNPTATVSTCPGIPANPYPAYLPIHGEGLDWYPRTDLEWERKIEYPKPIIDVTPMWFPGTPTHIARFSEYSVQ